MIREKNMAIFDRAPATWNELQNLVGQMFSEMGCGVTVGETLELVRGKKEIDVLVQDPSTIPPSQYLCECKYWKNPVPQEIVHSFRTVMADAGAQRGFIISSAGFQRGAHEAVQNTNTHLVTFDELQALFFDRWRVARSKYFMPYADRLFPYWDPAGGKRVPRGWGKDQSRQLELLNLAFEPFIKLGPVLELRQFVWQLPIQVEVLDDHGQSVGQHRLRTYRELFDFMELNKDAALQKYRALFGEAN
jgi:hypothetical protein